MDVLDVRVSRLKQIKELFVESKSLVSSICEEDPTKMDTLIEEEGAKAMEAETKVGACEEKLAGFRAAINAANPKKDEAAAPAVAPAASRTIGPKFERQSLPQFKSSKLRDYPTFKKDWREMVKGNFEPA